MQTPQGLTDGQMDGQMDGKMDRQMEGEMDRQMNRQMDRLLGTDGLIVFYLPSIFGNTFRNIKLHNFKIFWSVRNNSMLFNK